MRASDEYREYRMEGMGIVQGRGPTIFRSRRERWAVTVAKLYLNALRTGVTPTYPSEPELIVRNGWVR